jgi:plastocyanin
MQHCQEERQGLGPWRVKKQTNFRREEIMKTKYFIILLVALCFAAQLSPAGTLSGKVSGAGAGTVVWIDDPSAKSEASAKPFVMDQKGLVFVPHVLVVPLGATVDFLNSDSVQHNVFWTGISGNKKLGHNLGTWPKGEKRTFKFDNPGVVPLLCNVHPEMSAYIIVTSTPHSATTDANGEYSIDNVPDGAHNVTVWHEGMKQQSKQVNVSGATKADFTLTK